MVQTRRATIIVNVINIIFAILAVTALGAVSSDSFAANFDDDEVRQELEMGTQYAWVGMLFATISIITSGLGIYGAVKYTGWAVIVAAVWYTINCILSLIGADIGGAIMAGFFAYPHIVFFQEMRKGIMTEQNYPNEIHSCCCV